MKIPIQMRPVYDELAEVISELRLRALSAL